MRRWLCYAHEAACTSRTRSWLAPLTTALHAERSWGNPGYIKGLRATLDAAGFNATKIIAADGGIPADEIKALQDDAQLREAVFGLGR